MSTSNERMSNAPIYYALAQVKFTPIAAMSKYIAEIQDALRVEGFPLFEVNTLTQLKFEVQGPNEIPRPPSFEAVTQWSITDSDRTSGFTIGNDYISFHTTNYDTHEPFISSLMFGLSKVVEYARPSFVSRLGLRYLDAVLPEKGETIEQYLAKELHGLDFGLNPIQSTQETVFQTSVEPLVPHGFMVARIHKMNSSLGFPPDMVPNGVMPLEKFRNTEPRWHAVIDTDHYVEVDGKMKPDISLIEKQMLSLHNVIKISFKKTVSDFALAKWK